MATTLAGAEATACGGPVYGAPALEDESYGGVDASTSKVDDAGAPVRPAEQPMIIGGAEPEDVPTSSEVVDGGVGDGGVGDGGSPDASADRDAAHGSVTDAGPQR